jgi:uncharacterized pyridoxamine 5'-phosphate oxidase family protein
MHIPIKQLSRKELKFQSKPWITSAIKVSIHVKNKLYIICLKTKSTYYHHKFKYFSLEYTVCQTQTVWSSVFPNWIGVE